eukprot:350391-Chlamydomonas_euryale.AAC.6
MIRWQERAKIDKYKHARASAAGRNNTARDAHSWSTDACGTLRVRTPSFSLAAKKFSGDALWHFGCCSTSCSLPACANGPKLHCPYDWGHV